MELHSGYGCPTTCPMFPGNCSLQQFSPVQGKGTEFMGGQVLVSGLVTISEPAPAIQAVVKFTATAEIGKEQDLDTRTGPCRLVVGTVVVSMEYAAANPVSSLHFHTQSVPFQVLVGAWGPGVRTGVEVIHWQWEMRGPRTAVYQVVIDIFLKGGNQVEYGNDHGPRGGAGSLGE